MKYFKQFLKFWYNFIVGDDWRIALGVIAGLTIVGLLINYARIEVWWLFPLLVITLLTLSLWHTVSRSS